MKKERHSVVLASSLASNVYASRGHRSLGDGEKVTLAAGKGLGSLQDHTNMNSRGWNNSTRTSPSGMLKLQDNKENSKLPGVKKFQHVQSKLTAPVFAQRRLKHTGADRAGIAVAGGPLQSSTNGLNAHAPPLHQTHSANREEPNVPETSVPIDRFITIRYREEQLAPEFYATNSRQHAATLKTPGTQAQSTDTSQVLPQCTADENLQDRQARLQLQRLDAKDRLAQLAFPQTLAADNCELLAIEAPLLGEVGSMNPQVKVDCLEPSISASSAIVPIANTASPIGSTASVALRVQASGRELEPSLGSPTIPRSAGDSVTVAHAVDSSSDGAASHSLGGPQGSQVGLCSNNKHVDHTATQTELGSPYSVSVNSLTPEAVPFTTCVDAAIGPVESPQVLLRPTDFLPSAASTPEGAMLSPGGLPSPQAAQSSLMMPQSHQQSAGLSFVSRPCQLVAFAMWATLGKVDQTPGEASDCDGPSSAYASSPQVSAGLSVISSTPQAMAFNEWASIQRAHMGQSAASNLQKTPGAYTSTSPLSSVGPETVSKPDPVRSWRSSTPSTLLAGGGVSSVVGAAAPAHIRCNPLFEIDSPASTISALPERADALGGLAPTPTPTRKVLPPSLASTPMSAFSERLCSDLASPVGECSPGLFHENRFVGADMPSPAGAVSSTGLTAVDNAGHSSPKIMPSPAADIVITTFTASPIHKIACVEKQSSVQASVDSLVTPNKEAVDSEQDASMDPLVPVPPEVLSLISACDQGSPADHNSLPDPPLGSCSATKQDGLATASFVNCSSQSYPNTPSAASPTPTISVYATPLDAFATPTSLASVCSALYLTAMRMRSGPSSPSGQNPRQGDGQPSDFTFQRSLAQLDGCGLDSPMLIMGPAMPAALNNTSNSNTALPIGPGSPANEKPFGSPMPLVQLTPVQMRVLDQLAAHVVAALSPSRQPEAPGSLDSSPVHARQEQSAMHSEASSTNATAAAAAFNLAQLLAHLRSPLPVPVHQRSRTMHNLVCMDGAAIPTNHDGEDTLLVSESMVSARVPQPSALNEAAPEPCASPMPNFARLMAFLNGSGRVATVPSDPGAPSCQPAAAENNVGDPKAAAAELNFGHVLAQLHSPEHDLNAARPKNAAYCPGHTDSPIMLQDGHDSPATSEAASFGFSTAAKQMASRITPSTTPGGHGISFMRWAHDAGPPSFRLESDAPRGRANRTPATPMSFSFGASHGQNPMNEDATPVVGPHRAKYSPGVLGPFPKKLLHLHLSPVRTDSEEAQSGSASASPGDGGKALNVSFSVNAVGTSTGRNMGAGAFPAISFGPQPEHLFGNMATPKMALGSSKRQDRSEDGFGVIDAAQSAVRCSARSINGNMMRRSSSSPALSLGMWGGKTRGAAGASSTINTSQTPLQRGFTFDHVASLMATPIWPGQGTIPTAESTINIPNKDLLRGFGAALEQISMMASPNLLGIAAQGSPQETPGLDWDCNHQSSIVTHASDAAAGGRAGYSVADLRDEAYMPAAAFVWSNLIGNLHSPMPAVHGRQQYPHPTHSTAAAAAPSDNAAPVTVQASGSSSAGSLPVAVAAVKVAADSGPTPPPYEDLPDLIARGLCLSASATPQSLENSPLSAVVPDTCSVSGENITPLFCRASTQASGGSPAKGSPMFDADGPELVVTPASLDNSPVLCVLSPSDELAIKSVIDSNKSSAETLYAICTSGTTCTTEPAATQLCAEGPQAGTCRGAANIDQELGQSGPFFSFHVATQGSTRAPGSTRALPPPANTALMYAEEESPVNSTFAGAISATSPATDSPATNHFCQGSGSDAKSSSVDRRGCAQPTENVVMSVNAVQHLLDSAATDSATIAADDQKVSEGGMAVKQPSESDVITTRTNVASVPGVMMGTPASSQQHRVREAAVSPLTLSYLSAGTPPSTPPTAELVSTGKAASLLCHPKASPRLSVGSSSHFWAPSSSGPSAASGERITLEACNRRIRTNADLLLDFQGSPAHVAPTVPIAAVTGALTPRMKGAPPAAWDGAHAPLASVHNLLPSASGGGGNKAKLKPKDPPAMASGSATLTAARSHALQPGRGPPLQQLVASGIEYTLASAAAAVAHHGSAAPISHLPLSHRLGLWPSAAWGIPCNLPADAAVAFGTSLSAGPMKSAQGRLKLLSQAKAELETAATGRPEVTSRDVQTTPGLIKMRENNDDKVLEFIANNDGGNVAIQGQPGQRIGFVPERPAAEAGIRKPGFRSRIPLPLNMVTASTNTRPQVPSADAALSSDSELSIGTTGMPQERVLRRRRLLTNAAAAGGPQRVLAKRSTQRTLAHDVANITMALGEEEVRRRARVLGMRISPYLRNKQSKVRPPEVSKPKKG